MFCSLPQLILRSIFAGICGILAVCCIIVFYHICVHHKEEHMSRFIQRSQYTFITATICVVLMNGTTKLLYCADSETFIAILLLLWLALFAIQSYLLLLIFYIKLKKVFMKSPLRLSKNTNRAYTVMFIALPCGAVIGIGVFFVHPTVFVWIEIMFLLLFAALMISLVVLFIYKLVQVYKRAAASEKDEDLVAVITQTTLLATISIFLTIVNAINTAMYSAVDNIVYQWICHYIVLFDIITNFICVIIGFKIFKQTYYALCFHLDTHCRSCCRHIVLDQSPKTLRRMEMVNHTTDTLPPETR
eukprot:448573_1